MMRINCLKALALAGLAISIYLVWQHADYLLTGEIRGICGMMKTMHCASIEESDYSEWGGIPTASFGAFYFFVFAVYLFLARPSYEFVFDDEDSSGEKKSEDAEDEADLPPDPYWGIVMSLCFIGLASCAGFAFIAIFIIHGFCLGCVTIYATTALCVMTAIHWEHPVQFLKIAFGDLAASASRAGELIRGLSTQERMRLTTGIALVLMAAPLDLGLVPFLINDAKARDVQEKYLGFQAVPVQIQPWNMVKGSPDAPIQIYMFTDFQCPACRRFEKMLKTILADYSEDQYRLVYKHFPLGNDCNPLVPKENPMINHPQACSLAALAQAANEMGRFWDIKSMLYGYRDGDDLAVTIQQISIRSGISYSEWDKLAHDHDNLRKVVLDLGEALKLGVRGAPMVLINNRPLPSLRSRDVAQVIRLALEKKVAPLPASAAAGTESGPVGPAALPPEPPLTTPGPQATPVPGKPGPGL